MQRKRGLLPSLIPSPTISFKRDVEKKIQKHCSMGREILYIDHLYYHFESNMMYLLRDSIEHS